MSYSFNIWLSRGENGELRVGVRRVARQQSSMPSSVISSQSMHLGVLATASHAVSTQTLFVVYYKPRYDIYGFAKNEIKMLFLVLYLSCVKYQDKSVHHRVEHIFRGS